MDKRAARRIKDGSSAKGPARGRDGDRDASGGRWRSRFSQFIIVSVLVHATAFAVIWHFSRPEAPKKVIELINVSVLPLPGPAGGGGKSEEIKTPKEQPKKEEVPEKEPVKVPSKLEEKVKPEPKKKEPEKLEAPKPQPEMPAGPGQGPVGGGGKKVQEGFTGPVVQGGINFPYAWYLKAIQDKVTRNWSPPSISRKMKKLPVINFTILRDGSVVDISWDTHSGNDIFDRSAESAIRSLKKMQQLPAAFNGNSLSIQYTFIPEKI